MIGAAATIAAFMVAMWLISLVLKNASIVDVGWGVGFVLIAWAVHARRRWQRDRQRLLVAMTTIWGLRLSLYLFIRNHGKGEDYRYRAMRKRWGPRFPLISLGTVFALQGVLMWVVPLPSQLGQVERHPTSACWRGSASPSGWPVCVSRRRRCATGEVQEGPHERRQGDGPRAVALYPPSQLLR